MLKLITNLAHLLKYQLELAHVIDAGLIQTPSEKVNKFPENLDFIIII